MISSKPITYHTWSNNGGDFMWYNASIAEWEAVTGAATQLSSAFNCQNGFCQHKTTGGACLGWDKANNSINNETCASPPVPRQEWEIITGSFSEDEWLNRYADDVYSSNGSCIYKGLKYAPLLSEGAFQIMDMECPSGGNSPGPLQLWSGH